MCGILFLLRFSYGLQTDDEGRATPGSLEEEKRCRILLDSIVRPINRRGPDSPVAPASVLEPSYAALDGTVITYSECAVLHVRGENVQPQPLINAERNVVLLWNGEVFGLKQNIDNEIFDLHANDTRFLYSRLVAALGEVQSGESSACFDAVHSVLSNVDGPFAFVIRFRDKVYFGRDCFGRRSLIWSGVHPAVGGPVVSFDSFNELNKSYFTLSSCAPDLPPDSSSLLRMEMCTEVPHHGLFCMQLPSNPVHQLDQLQFRPWTLFKSDCFLLDAGSFCGMRRIRHERLRPGACFDPENTLEDCCEHEGQCFYNHVTDSFYDAGRHFSKWARREWQAEVLPIDDSSNKFTSEEHIRDEVIERLSLMTVDDAEGKNFFEAALQIEMISKLLEEFEQILTDAVRRRCFDFHRRRSVDGMCADDYADVAVLFSGGIDSTIVAVLLHRCLPLDEPIALHNVAFCAADISADVNEISALCSKAPDRITAENTYAVLRKSFPERRWLFRCINITRDELAASRSQRIAQLIYPNTTVLDDSIGCALWFAVGGGANRSWPKPLIVFSGLGADELFGGYSRHHSLASTERWTALERELLMDVCRIGARNCGRDDRVVSDHGCELRLPFLDEKLVKFAMERVPVRLKILLNRSGEVKRGVGDKFLLRLLAYGRLGLGALAREPKRAMQFGTRIAKLEQRHENANEPCERLINAIKNKFVVNNKPVGMP